MVKEDVVPEHGNWSGQELYSRFNHQKITQGKINWEDAKDETGMTKSVMRGRYRRYRDNLAEGAHYTPAEAVTSSGPKPTFTDGGNTAEVSWSGPEERVVINPDQLLEIAGIDLSVWRLADKGVEERSWGQNSNEFGYRTMYYVRAPLVRIKPIPTEWDPIAPIRLGALPPFDVPVPDRASKLTVVIPDLQVGYRRNVFTGEYEPYHDRHAIGLALDYCYWLQPDLIIIGGDILDAPEASNRFTPEPEHRFTFQAAVIEAGFILASLRQLCHSSKIVALEGNHDKRVTDVIVKSVNQFAYGLHAANHLGEYPILSLPFLLDMDALGIEWVGGYPDARYKIGHRLFAEHGAMIRSESGATSKAMAGRWLDSIVFCHIHRRELFTKTRYSDGERHEVTAASPGTLSKVDGSVPGSTDRRNWQQGILKISSYADHHQINLLAIQNGILVDGTHYFDRGILMHESRAHILRAALEDGLKKITKFR